MEKDAKFIINRKWKEIQKIFINNFDKDKYRLTTYLDHNNIPQLQLKEKSRRVNTPNFQITFINRDHPTFSTKNKSATDVLWEFIHFEGVEDVKRLNIKTSGGYSLISETKENIKHKSPKQIDDYYIITKTSTREKIAQIEEIIERLHLKNKVFVELI